MLLIINDVTKYLIEQDKLIAIESIETRNKLLLNIKGENFSKLPSLNMFLSF